MPGASFEHACERFWKPLWVLFLAGFVVVMVGFSRRMFWYDELFTLYLSQVSPARLWQALLSGVDQNSPVFYLLSGFTARWTPDVELGLRLPALAGGMVALTCVFVYVRGRCGALWAWVAVWLLLASHAAYYMAEARPYGIMLGCTAGAFLAWQRRSFFWMTAALAVAALSHAYSLLIFIPLVAGEVARRQFDGRAWIAFGMALSAFSVYVPIRGGVHGTMAYSWARPELQKLPEAWLDYLGSATPLAIAILLVLAVWCLLQRRTDEPESGALPLPESVALAALMLLPVAGLALGKLTGIYAPRYTIECTIGLATGFTLLLFRAVRGNGAFALLVCLTVITWQVWGFARIASQTDTRNLPAPLQESVGLTGAYDLLPYVERSQLPLVVSSGLMFLEIDHYATPQLAARMNVLLDEQTAIEHTGVNVTEVGLPVMKKWFPIRSAVRPYGDFTAAHPHFLVYGYWESRTANDWLVYRLMRDGANVRLIARTDRFWREPAWAPGLNDSRFLYLFDVLMPDHLPSTENASSTLPGAPPKLP